jgi:hypothetical protein
MSPIKWKSKTLQLGIFKNYHRIVLSKHHLDETLSVNFSGFEWTWEY